VSANAYELRLLDESATAALAAQFADAVRIQKPRSLIYLYGDLGAGKSSFARACLRSLGVQGAIKSPTYTLIESYQVGELTFLHMDLYRIADPFELDYLGLDTLLSDAVLSLIEWPQRGVGMLPTADLEFHFSYDEADANARRVRIVARSALGHQLQADFLA
jgi:tRNA threonylcarbamoyladenosine biosynthesis protein TsaE